MEPTNLELKKVREDSQKRQDDIEKREKEKKELNEILEKTLYKACYDRDIILGKKVLDIPESYNVNNG